MSAAKQTLSVTLPNGQIVTRTTARAYTHVVVAVQSAESVAAWTDRPKRFPAWTASTVAYYVNLPIGHVYAGETWHGSESAALKAAVQQSALGGSRPHCRMVVLPVN